MTLLVASTMVWGSVIVPGSAHNRAGERPTPRVAVLDFGETEFGRQGAEQLAAALGHPATPTTITTTAAAATSPAPARLSLIDRDLSRAAARGAGYAGSLNMALEEARDLAAAIGCDFFITGAAEIVRRSPAAAPVYYEAYASLFVVSARTGRLLLWDRPTAERTVAEEAGSTLLRRLSDRSFVDQLAEAIVSGARDDERMSHPPAEDGRAAALVEDLPEDAAAAARGGDSPPRPYRRVPPPYPDTAARAEVEAVVDVSVVIGADGEVARAEVVRWAGFGLDEAVIATVRQMHFHPALRRGVPVPVRVLLRYNFRRPGRPRL